MSMLVPAVSLSVKSLYDPELATVDSPKTFLAEAASNAVITPTIGAVDEPVPPFWTGRIPSTSTAKSTLLTVISLLLIVRKSWPVIVKLEPDELEYKANGTLKSWVVSSAT